MADKMSPSEFGVTLRRSAASVRQAVPKALRAVGVALVGLVRRGFNESRDPWGNTWKPLAYRKGKPLEDRGILRSSFTAKVVGKSVLVGTAMPYAAIHNFGGRIEQPERRRDRPWVFTGRDGVTVFTRHIRAHTITIPRRTMLAWSPAWLVVANKVVAKVLGDAGGALTQGKGSS